MACYGAKELVRSAADVWRFRDLGDAVLAVERVWATFMPV